MKRLILTAPTAQEVEAIEKKIDGDFTNLKYLGRGRLELTFIMKDTTELEKLLKDLGIAYQLK
jgi:hypothetical protein